MAESTSILQILLQLKDEATAALSDSAKKSADALKQLGDQAKAVGEPIALAGAAITGAVALAVDAAAKEQSATERMNTTIGNVIETAKKSTDAHGAYATQVSFLESKINSAKASIAVATAELEKHGKSAALTAAQHEKLHASIAAQESTMNKYQQQLELITNAQSLASDSLADISSKFDQAARSSTDLGFKVDESKSSLTNLFAATHSVADAMKANEIAMDLARAKGVDLQTATGYVTKAFQGQGRALIDLGINLKDGLSGMQALGAISDVTKGQADEFSKTLAGAMDVTNAKQELLAATLGEQLIPMLTKLVEVINNVITKITEWTEKHPELTKAIMIVVAALGVLLTVVGTALIAFGVVASTLAAIAIAFGVTVGAVVLFTAGIIAAIVALAVIVVLIIRYHTQIWDFMKKIWADIEALVVEVWDGIANAVKAGINDVIGFINGFIGTVNKIQIHIPAIGVGPLKTPAMDWGGMNIPNIPALAGGGIVLGPTLALIGEAGPEAVVPLGGGQGGMGTVINININGGMYTDPNSVRKLANVIATTINQTLKLRTI